MTENSKFVSVVITAFQASTYIADAIESVLQQTHPYFELIILDDASTDNTLQIIDSFAKQDNRIKVIKHTKNIGYAPSMTKLVKSGQYDWVFILDADDRMLPNRIERQLHFIKEHPQLVLAGALCNYIDLNNKIIAHYKSDLYSIEAVTKFIQLDKPIWFPVVALHRPTAQKIGFYKNLVTGSDTEIYSHLASSGLVLCQQEILGEYRKLPKSSSVKNIKISLVTGRWISACMQARRLNIEEPTLEAYINIEKRLPTLKRLAIKLHDTSNIFFKNSVASFSCRNYFQAIFWGFLAGIFWPPTLWWRFRNRKLSLIS